MRSRRTVLPADLNEKAGSPLSGEPAFLAVGVLRKGHGVHGEVLMDVLTDFPRRLRARKTVYIGENHEPHLLTHVRTHAEALLLSIEGVEDLDAAEKFRNLTVYVRTEDVPPLPDGTYYHHQLVGIKVVDESGKEIGHLTEILETGANDVYVVVNEAGEETLFPAIVDVIVSVDVSQGVMTVRPQEWD